MFTKKLSTSREVGAYRKNLAPAKLSFWSGYSQLFAEKLSASRAVSAYRKKSRIRIIVIMERVLAVVC